jgi:hypothetical protein
MKRSQILLNECGRRERRARTGMGGQGLGRKDAEFTRGYVGIFV